MTTRTTFNASELHQSVFIVSHYSVHTTTRRDAMCDVETCILGRRTDGKDTNERVNAFIGGRLLFWGARKTYAVFIGNFYNTRSTTNQGMGMILRDLQWSEVEQRQSDCRV